MLAASLQADVPLFIASPTSAWATAGRVVRAVAGHRDEVTLGLLGPDARDLVLGLRLGHEVVDAGLVGDRPRRQRVVAGDHDRADAHPAELVEALAQAGLDGVLELDDAERPPVPADRERRRAQAGDLVADRLQLRRRRLVEGGLDRVHRALEDDGPVGEDDAARPRLGRERDDLGDGSPAGASWSEPAPEPRAGPGQLDDRAALGRLVVERREQRRLDASRSATPGSGTMREASRLPNVIVPVLSRRITSTSPDASTARPLIARTLKRATRSMPGDPDRREQAADRRRDQADEERDEHDDPERRVRVEAERPERRGREQEDDRQAGQEDRQRDLVRRPLPLRALDEGDHPVEERLARVGGDADRERVAGDRRAAGDRAPDVGARLLEDRRGLAGDRRPRSRTRRPR